MSDSSQKVISSKNVFSSKLFTVEEEILQHKDKHYTFHTVFAHPVASVIPITPKGEIYLIHQYRYLFKESQLGIISGFVDERETPLQAAKRELMEEAGIEATEWIQIAKVAVMRSVVKHFSHIFVAKDLLITKPNLQDEEEIEVVKMPLSEAVNRVMNGEIYHSTSITGILMLNELKRRKLI